MPTLSPRHAAVFCSIAALLTALACHPAAAPASNMPAGERLTDNRIAGTVLLLNNIETGTAALALERAVSPDVQTYARRVQTDHAALNASLRLVIDASGIVAQDDAGSAALRDAALAQRERLRTAPVRAFDAAYIDADLQSHGELLRSVERLLADARRPALREYLTALAPVLAAHVAHAEQLRATLAARAR